MAVALEDDFAALKLLRLKIRNVAGEEFAEQQGLFAQALGAAVIGKEVDELITEHAGAAGFEEDEGQAGVDLGGEALEDLQQVGAGLPQESKVVERSAAANVLARHFDGEARALQDAGRRFEGLRVVVVIPGVRP